MDLSSAQLIAAQQQLNHSYQPKQLIQLLLEQFLRCSGASHARLIDLDPEPYHLAAQRAGQACEFDPASPAELTQKQLMFAQTQQAVDWQYQALSVDHWHLLIWPNTVNRSLCLAFQHAHFSPSWLTEHPLFDSLLRQIGYHFQLQKTNLTLRQKKHAKQAFAAKAQLQQEQEAQFIESLMLLQAVNLSLSNAHSLDQLHRQAVESLRHPLNFDRSALFLMNPVTAILNPTYGTDNQGNTTDEHTHVYDAHKMSPIFMHTALHTQDYFVVLEDVPLFTESKVVGYGWNAMLILRDGETMLGWMALDNLINRKPITRHDKELLRAFAHMFSQILVRKRAEESLRMLYNSADQLSAATTVLDVCRAAVLLAKQELMLDRVAIFLSDDNGKHIRGTYGSDLNGQITDETWYYSETPKSDLVQNAIANENVLIVEEPATLYHNNEPVGTGWNAILQLRSDNKIIGLLCADNLIHGHTLNLHTQQLIRLFGANLSEMIARKQAEENLIKLNRELEEKVQLRTQELELTNQTLAQANLKLEQLIQTDALTGVANRRALDESLLRAWHQACRNQLSLIVVMLDIDHFKPYNDHYGHLQGDEALKQVAHLLADHFRRADDIIARYGGEEFAIVIMGSHLSDAAQRVRHAIQALANQAIPHQACPIGKITLSAGMAQLDNEQPQSTTTLLNQADVALYQAKKNGKNQLAIFSQAAFN